MKNVPWISLIFLIFSCGSSGGGGGGGGATATIVGKWLLTCVGGSSEVFQSAEVT